MPLPYLDNLFFFQAEDGIRDFHVTGVQTCALPISEDRLASLHLGEDELGAGKAGTIEHEIDRCSPPAAEQDRRLLDDLDVLGPGLLEAVAVGARGRRPRLARLQNDPLPEREQQQVGQLAVWVWVATNEEDPAAIAHAAAA